MSKRSTRCSEEFKQQIIDLYNTDNNKVSSLSSEYGVSIVVIYKWTKELSQIKISNTQEISAKDYDLTAAKRSIFEYIEWWYNRKRIHRSINYMTISEFHKIA